MKLILFQKTARGNVSFLWLSALKERNPNLKVVGFTATPYRLNSGMLTEGDGSIFDDVAVDFGSGDNFIRLIDDGYLSPLVTKCMDY